jgi:hypothetical protein
LERIAREARYIRDRLLLRQHRRRDDGQQRRKQRFSE